jgi:hypothetical protein
MSNWSSEAVSQRRDSIITKGKNDKAYTWSSTDYRHSSCILFFFLFFNIYVLIKYISINIVWNKYLEYMNIGLANIIPSK